VAENPSCQNAANSGPTPNEGILSLKLPALFSFPTDRISFGCPQGDVSLGIVAGF